MEIIAKISRGTKMDQIYIPKQRAGFQNGRYVIIKPIEDEIKKPKQEKPIFYNIKSIEPIKIKLISEIFSIIEHETEEQFVDNLLIVGSFLEKGFYFNDIDILIIINKTEIKIDSIKKRIQEEIGITPHIIQIKIEDLIKGVSSDPLYENMLSKYIAKKRLILKYKRKINYKILDLHLLKSKSLIDNFEILSGKEKYYLIKNMLAIDLFIKKEKISNEILNKQIKEIFKIEAERIKENLIANKQEFIKKCRNFYNNISKQIQKGIKKENESK